MNIHKTAIIEKGAEIAKDIIVGEHAIIRKDVKIAEGNTISANVVIEGKTTIGKNNFIGIGTVIGNPPQDLKYADEETEVVIGDNNTIREYVTINRGTTDRMRTSIGNNTLLMTYCHIAHDCIVSDNVIISNSTQLAGHITIEEHAIVGGICALHQFIRIGKMAYVGGGNKVPKDVPPFCLMAGDPLRVFGLNKVGLKRKGYSDEECAQLKKAYKILFHSGLNTKQAVQKVESIKELDSEPVSHLLNFIKSSKRGISKA